MDVMEELRNKWTIVDIPKSKRNASLKAIVASRRKLKHKLPRLERAGSAHGYISCVLLLAFCGGAGGQRELLGWSQQSRLTDSLNHLYPTSYQGHLYPNVLPQKGACLNGTIITSVVTLSVTHCELRCGRTPGCSWFAYCASQMDVSLDISHTTSVLEEHCNDNRDIYGKDGPMSMFGSKRDKCVLYSKCLRVGINRNGTLPYFGFHIYQFAPRGVMTGRNSIFPEELPDKLKVKFHVPDSLHPNLRFWFTPDQLDQEGHANGDRIQVWRNVANICYRGHPEFMMDPNNDSIILGNCNSTSGGLFEPYTRGQWPQEYGEVTNFVQTIGNSQKEILYQHNPTEMPQYRTNMANGHSSLRFRRKNLDGSKGKFMYMYTSLGDKTGFQKQAHNPFGGNSDACSSMPAYRGAKKEFTLFLVAKTFSMPGDINFHGILNIIGGSGSDRWRGLSLFKNSATCVVGRTPACANGFTSFSALDMVFGDTPKWAYTDCSLLCGRQGCAFTGIELSKLGKKDCSCSISNPNVACLESWGPPGAQNLQDPDAEWRLISIRGRDKLLEGFIDGYHASPKPPLVFKNEEIFESVEQFRLGLLDEPGAARNNFLNGDIAEMLIYNKALTNQEMDRITNYLKNKFRLHNVRLDDDVASPLRSVAISKPPGCGHAMSRSKECNDTTANFTPYSTDGLIEVHMGEPYDMRSGSGYCPNPSPQPKDREVFTITGWYILPTDLDTNGRPQVVPSDVTFLDVDLNEQYLKVTIGKDEETEAQCHIHSVPAAGTWVCTSTGVNWGRLEGIRHGVPIKVETEVVNVSASESWTFARLLINRRMNTTCPDGDLKWLAPTTGNGKNVAWTAEESGFIKPALRCEVLGGVREGKQINLYWYT